MKFKPHIVLNFAAESHVDKVEKCVEEAYMINSDLPLVLSLWANKNSACLIHFSTDYVFDVAKKINFLQYINCKDNNNFPIMTRELNQEAKKPLFSKLGNNKLKNIFGIVLPCWQSD